MKILALSLKQNQKFFIHPKRVLFFAISSFVLASFFIVEMRDAQAVAGVNETINFQGRVANTDGTNVADGNYDFVFRLYKASSGGSAQWTETWNSGTSQVAVTNGIFRVALGTHASLSSLDFNDDSWYLSVEFNGDGEMDPRIRFASVPYALNAKTVSGLTVTSTTGTFTLASGKTFVVNNGLTFSGTDSTTFTFPSASGTVVTLDAAQTLTNKTIGSTGLVFSGAATDITTVSNEDFVISPNGTGKIGFGTTTPNAFFDVAGAASISGQLTLYTTPQIQSAANQTLIIGGDTTGFINLKPLDGAGAVVVNAAAFEVYSASGFGNSNNFTSISADGDLSFVGTADYLIAPGGKYAFRYSGDENYGLFFDDGAASYDFRNGSAANVFRVSALSGTLVSAAYTTNGGLIYSTGSGVFTQLGAGTTGQCLNANTSAAPSWGSCGGGGGGSSNWVLDTGLGTLSPVNNTLDFLIGGTATSSAKFAVLNVADGTPTASVSSGVDGYGTYFDADGNIQTTRNQTLTLGGDTTGDIQFKPGNSSDSLYLGSNGNVGIGAAASSNYDLEIQRSNGTVDQSFFLADDPGTVSAFASIDFSALNSSSDPWTIAYDSEVNIIESLAVDEKNGVIYAGSGITGVIFRCEISTSCNSGSDWSIAVDTAARDILEMKVDTTNDVIYAGSSQSGVVYRCALSTDCDASGDWSVALDTSDTSIYSLTFDPVNDIMYAGSWDSVGAGDIYRCDTTSLCDESADWSTVYTTSTGNGIISLEYDPVNAAIYAGEASAGIVHRCLVSTDCDASGDWSTMVAAGGVVYDLTVDTTAEVIYATTSNSGIIYRCDLSTGCDAGGEWSSAYDSASSVVYSLTVDSANGILYAGGSSGMIYSCETSSGCDSDIDWSVEYSTGQSDVYSVIFEPSQEVVYAGSASNGIIFRHVENFIGTKALYAQVQSLATVTGDGLETGALIFNTAVSGGSSEAMRLANGMVGINNNSPISALHVTRPLTLPATGKALAVFDQIENQDIFTASSSGTARFTITRAGGLKLGTSEGSSGECLKSGGAGNAVVWGSCGGGGQTPWTSNIDADNFSLLDLGTNITARNGLTLGTGSNGNLMLSPNGSGDVVISGDGDTNLQVTFSAAPTVDMAVISNSGFGTTTSGVNGLTIDFVQGDDGDDTDINSGLIVNVTSTSDDIDQVIGIGIGNLTKNAAMGVGLIIGTGWDAGLVIASGGSTNSGLVYTGSGRPTKTITLSPEYAGAVLTNFYGAGTDSNTTGAMTSDTDTTQGTSIRNYYQWERTVDSTQHFYTVAVRVTLPADFDDWTSSNAVRVSYITESATNTVSDLDVRIYNENDSSVVASDLDNASTSWATVDFAGSTLNDGSGSEWDAAGETAVIYLRMGSASSNYVRVGDIQLNYLAKF